MHNGGSSRVCPSSCRSRSETSLRLPDSAFGRRPALPKVVHCFAGYLYTALHGHSRSRRLRTRFTDFTHSVDMHTWTNQLSLPTLCSCLYSGVIWPRGTHQPVLGGVAIRPGMPGGWGSEAFTGTCRPAVASALDAVPEAYHNPAAVWWGLCSFRPACRLPYVSAALAAAGAHAGRAAGGAGETASHVAELAEIPGPARCTGSTCGQANSDALASTRQSRSKICNSYVGRDPAERPAGSSPTLLAGAAGPV
jgi:hypothetical protein